MWSSLGVAVCPHFKAIGNKVLSDGRHSVLPQAIQKVVSILAQLVSPVHVPCGQSLSFCRFMSPKIYIFVNSCSGHDRS